MTANRDTVNGGVDDESLVGPRGEESLDGGGDADVVTSPDLAETTAEEAGTAMVETVQALLVRVTETLEKRDEKGAEVTQKAFAAGDALGFERGQGQAVADGQAGALALMQGLRAQVDGAMQAVQESLDGPTKVGALAEALASGDPEAIQAAMANSEITPVNYRLGGEPVADTRGRWSRNAPGFLGGKDAPTA